MINEIPLTVLSAVVLLSIGLQHEINRTDGIMLLCFFAIFMRYVLAQSSGKSSGNDVQATVSDSASLLMPMWKSCMWIAVGLICLLFGGNRFVAGASDVARLLGVSEAVIGLTIVAIGTSLPELAASLAAARKGHTDMALGNVIGSNIFNIFLVLGVSATITPLPFGDISMTDLWVMLGACCLFWLCGRIIGRNVITRVEGALMLLCYVAYTIYLVLTATGA